MTKHWLLAPATFLLAALASAAPPASGDARPAESAPSGPAAIRFLVPNDYLNREAQRELGDVIADYNREHPSTNVQIVRRGSNFSSLRELMAMHLAGDTPDIAAIETSEFPAIEEIALARTLPPALVSKLVPSPRLPRKIFTLPFMRVAPILVTDQEMLFRVHADSERLPSTWKGLVELARNLSGVLGSGPDRYALALPLEGTRGLWVFEALAGRPLWTRMAGGLQADRELAPAIEQLRQVIDQPRLSHADLTWDRALQDFLDRKCPLLATSSDMLPYIAKQAGFRWTVSRLPDLPGSPSALESGSDLIVTRNTPEILGFLEYLYSAPAASRWAKAGAYLPLRKDWEKSGLWKNPVLALRHRSTDSEVVRAHTEWVSALHFLFGEKNKRLTPETVFTQLDTELISK